MENEIYCLIADIGGTNTRLGLVLFHDSEENPQEVRIEFYETTKDASLSQYMEEFLSEYKGTSKWPKLGMLACAGAVYNNATHFSNIDWTIEGNELAKKFNIKTVTLMNDFTAKGYSILKIPKNEMIIMQDAPIIEGEPKLVLGPGTGLGMALVQPYPKDDGGWGYIVRGTEGSHSSFPIVTELEKEFCDFFLKEVPGYKEEFGYMQNEKVYCGPSVPWIYKFFCKKEGKDPEDLKSEDVFERGLKNTDPICRKCIEFWAGVYGNQTADFALTILPYGGIYLVGNMTQYLQDFLVDPHGPFMKRYFSKDKRDNEKLSRFPMFLVQKKRLGLYGAAVKAQRDYFGLK